jgi:hypothetical protein
MNKKVISVCVKSIIVLLCVTGIACCIMMNRIIDYLLPGFSAATHYYWLLFLIFCAAPCFIALVPAWLISSNIGKGKAFCKQNATYMKAIAVLMAIDSIIIFAMNIIFYAIGMSFFAFFIAFFLIFAIFFALSTCSFALSSLLNNASELQEQSDLTI